MAKFFKQSILLATTLILGFSSCQGDNTLTENPNKDVDKTILVRITQSPPVTRGVSRPIPDGELLEFNRGDLYLVNSIGIVVRHFQITSGATPTNLEEGIINISDFEFDTATNTDVLTLNVNVPSNTTYVYIIGNTEGNSSTESSRINTIGERIFNIHEQYNAWNVNLFGRTTQRLTHIPGDYNIREGERFRIYRGEIYLAPTVARFEIAEIRGSGNIEQFRVAGIFMDNFVRQARVNGELITSTLWSGGAVSERFAPGGAYGNFITNPTQLPTSGGALFDQPMLSNTPPSLGVRPQGTPVTWIDRHGETRIRPLLWSYQVFAPSSRTATTLTAEQQPRIIIRLSDITLIDGTEIEGYRYVTVRDFKDAGVPFAGIQAGEVYHIAAVVFDDNDLEPLPNLQDPVYDPSALITTFTRVLYDFQRQRLETWPTTGVPVAWKWHVSTSQNGVFVPIPNADADNWLLPVDFIHNEIFTNIDQLYFRTVITLDDGTRITQAPENTLPIRFVRTTNTATGGLSDFRPGFNITPDGTRYAVLRRAAQANPATGNTIRVALLNLGAERIGNEETGGLGDLFQWGRIADGHQHIGWFSDPISGATTFRGTGTVTERCGTSAAVARVNSFNTDGQATGATNIGAFIQTTIGGTTGDWSTRSDTPAASGNRNLWGAGASRERLSDRPTRTGANAAPVTLAGWTDRAQRNNPCQSVGANWRVPSHFDWVDMHQGDGSILTGSQSTTFPTTGAGGGNIWYWYEALARAVGAAVLRNPDNGAFVILPAAGVRAMDGSSSLGGGNTGRYWTSTQNTHSAALNVQFGNITGTVAPPISFGVWIQRTTNEQHARYRGHGMSVRCVW